MARLPTPTADLHPGDSLELLSSIPDGSIQLVVCDPPYFLSRGGSTVSGGRRVPVDKGHWDHNNGYPETHEFNLTWLAEAQRALTPDGALWVAGSHHNLFSVGHALATLGFRVLQEIVWFKASAPPDLGRRNFRYSHESLIWASRNHDAQHTFNYDWVYASEFPEDRLKKPHTQMRDVWQLPRARKWEKRYGKHPTQKPELLMERMILATSHPGDTVLDPFIGSGTTGVAAVRHGRNVIGMDSSPVYLDIAARRISDEVGPQQLTVHS